MIPYYSRFVPTAQILITIYKKDIYENKLKIFTQLKLAQHHYIENGENQTHKQWKASLAYEPSISRWLIHSIHTYGIVIKKYLVPSIDWFINLCFTDYQTSSDYFKPEFFFFIVRIVFLLGGGDNGLVIQLLLIKA